MIRVIKEHEPVDCGPPLVVLGAVVVVAALAFFAASPSQPAGATARAAMPGERVPLHERNWGRVDLALDRAERTAGVVGGSRCMPEGSPGSTLVKESERLAGRRLKRVATAALKSPEFLALHHALRDRGFRPLPYKPYGRASRQEKLIIVAYMDARGHGAFAGLLEGKGESAGRSSLRGSRPSTD